MLWILVGVVGVVVVLLHGTTLTIKPESCVDKNGCPITIYHIHFSLDLLRLWGRAVLVVVTTGTAYVLSRML